MLFTPVVAALFSDTIDDDARERNDFSLLDFDNGFGVAGALSKVYYSFLVLMLGAPVALAR